MRKPAPFALKALSRVLSGLILGLSMPAQAQPESIGKVLVVRGTVEARDASGAVRLLARSSELFESDTIVVGAEGYAQLKMADDAIIKLKSDTEFAFNTYSFDNNAATPDSAAMSMVRGGFMTISGTIGDADEDDYRVDTPYASIGIRGTMHSALIVDGGLLTGVYDGGTTISNNQGSIDAGIGADFDFTETRNGEAPHGLIEAPTVLGQIEDLTPELDALDDAPPADGDAPDAADAQNAAGNQPAGDNPESPPNFALLGGNNAADPANNGQNVVVVAGQAEVDTDTENARAALTTSQAATTNITGDNPQDELNPLLFSRDVVELDETPANNGNGGGGNSDGGNGNSTGNSGNAGGNAGNGSGNGGASSGGNSGTGNGNGNSSNGSGNGGGNGGSSSGGDTGNGNAGSGSGNGNGNGGSSSGGDTGNGNSGNGNSGSGSGNGNGDGGSTPGGNTGSGNSGGSSGNGNGNGGSTSVGDTGNGNSGGSSGNGNGNGGASSGGDTGNGNSGGSSGNGSGNGGASSGGDTGNGNSGGSSGNGSGNGGSTSGGDTGTGNSGGSSGGGTGGSNAGGTGGSSGGATGGSNSGGTGGSSGGATGGSNAGGTGGSSGGATGGSNAGGTGGNSGGTGNGSGNGPGNGTTIGTATIEGTVTDSTVTTGPKISDGRNGGGNNKLTIRPQAIQAASNFLMRPDSQLLQWGVWNTASPVAQNNIQRIIGSFFNTNATQAVLIPADMADLSGTVSYDNTTRFDGMDSAGTALQNVEMSFTVNLGGGPGAITNGQLLVVDGKQGVWKAGFQGDVANSSALMTNVNGTYGTSPLTGAIQGVFTGTGALPDFVTGFVLESGGNSVQGLTVLDSN